MNAYDFDKTIYHGDSSADFFFHCLKKHPKIMVLGPSVLMGFIKYYILKKGTKTQFKEKVFRFVSFVDIDNELKLFWEKNSGKIKTFYKEQQKPDDVIISASPEFLLAPICKQLGISHLIASDVDQKNGKFNRLNCHGKEKVVRFRELFGDSKVERFYSDSYSDTPMAEISDHAFIVKGEMLSDWDFSRR